MKKIVFASVCLTAFVALADKFMFSSDGEMKGSGLRECPSQSINLKTGEVMVGLHAMTDVQRMECGWYRYTPVDKPDTNNYYRVTNYVFTATGTVYNVWTKYTPKPKQVKYSKLAIIEKLEKMDASNGYANKWEEVKAAISARGYIDKWNACTYISADDANFLAIKPSLAAILGITEKNLDDILSGCQY